MLSRLSRIFQVAVAYAGAVIGAGFVSGREVVQFFAVYGGRGLLGAGLAAIAFAVLGGAAAYISRAEGRHDYRDLANYLGGPGLGVAFSALITLTLASALVVMMAGGGALARQQLGWTYLAGVGGTTAAIILILASDLKGLLWFNGLLVPALLVGQFALAVATLKTRLPETTRLLSVQATRTAPPWWVMGLFYAGYNLVVGLSILPPATRRVKRPGEAALAAAVGGLALGLGTLATTALSLRLWPAVAGVEIPTAYAVAQLWPGRQGAVSTALWLAMVMSGTANAYGLGPRLGKVTCLPVNAAAIVIVLACLPLTRLGFSGAIGLLYPIAGAGAILIITIAVIRRIQAGR